MSLPVTLACGLSGYRTYHECAEPVEMTWERWADADELAEVHASGVLPAHETECRLAVYGCRTHVLARGFGELTDYLDEDGEPTGRQWVAGNSRLVDTHDATCHAPADPGDCGVCVG